MSPEELNTLIFVGVPTATGICSYGVTQQVLKLTGRRLVHENRFDELIQQGFVEGIYVPAIIMALSTLGASLIGETNPLDPLVALSIVTVVCASMVGCVIGGRVKRNFGQTLKELYPNAKSRIVVDGVVNNTDQSLPESHNGPKSQ